MPVMDVVLDTTNLWPDLKEMPHAIIHTTTNLQVAVMEGGMASGRPSIMIRIDLPDGRVVLFETSARIYCSGAKIIMAKFPDLFEGD